jgi:hypothetical protein
MFWNSRALPELQQLNFRDRMAVLRRAADQLPTPQKLILNVWKLCVLIPPFLLIARAETVLHAAGLALGLVLIYPLLTRPVTFALVRPLLTQARRQLEL